MKFLIVSVAVSMSLYASNACEHIKGPVSLLIYAKSMPASPYIVRDGIVYRLALLPCLPQDHHDAQKIRDHIKRINEDIRSLLRKENVRDGSYSKRRHNRHSSKK